MLRLIHALPDPAVIASPRMLGVGELALRRCTATGPLLIDVETRRPVEILEQRSAESFAAWPAVRPGAS